MSKKNRTILGVLTFLVTAIVVYYFVVHHSTASSDKQPASAEIHQKASPLPDPSKVVERLLSDEHLGRSLERIQSSDDTVPSLPIAQFREALVIEPLESTEPGSLRIRVTVQDTDPARAISLANSLVQQYADEEHVRLETTIWQEHQAAQQATREAYERWIEVERQWKAMQSTQPNDSFTPELPPPPSVTPQKSEPARESKMVDNPEWVAMFEEVANLTRRRAELLERMTPLHPQVQSVERKIKALESQMASISNVLPERRLYPKTEEIAPSVEQTLSAPNPTEHPELARLFNVTRENHAKLKQLEHESEQRMLDNPDVEIVLATRGTWNPFSRIQPLALIVSIGVGLCFATAVGFFAPVVGMMQGFQRSDKTFSSTDEVESVLSIPVLGRISLHRDD